MGQTHAAPSTHRSNREGSWRTLSLFCQHVLNPASFHTQSPKLGTQEQTLPKWSLSLWHYGSAVEICIHQTITLTITSLRRASKAHLVVPLAGVMEGPGHALFCSAEQIKSTKPRTVQLLGICASENGLSRVEPQACKTWVLQYSAPWKWSADQDLDFCCFRRSLTSPWPVKSWQCWPWPTAYRTWRSGWEEWWWPVTKMDSLWQQTTWYVHLRSSRELKVPDLPNPGTKPGSPKLQANSWLSEPPGATCNQENESLLHVTGYNGNFCSHLFLLKVPIILQLNVVLTGICNVLIIPGCNQSTWSLFHVLFTTLSNPDFCSAWSGSLWLFF